jgi:signal transduction histidine kinase/ActR/RegA family two-component response regulator
MKLRTSLLWLAIAAMTPLLVVLLVGGALVIEHERESVAREALGRARSAMSAVDAELRGSLTVLQALAASKHLAAGDLREFYEEAKRVLASQPEWLNIGLTTAARVQVIDVVLPYGKPKALDGDEESFELALKTGKPAIGNVAAGAAVAEPAIRIRMPIVQDGTMKYVLSVPIKPSSLAEVLRAQRIPPDWVIALADRNRKFIARIPEAPVGSPVSDSFRAAIERAPEGWFAGHTLEGAATYTPYVTSELTGWVLGIAMPRSVVEAGARQAARVAAAGILIALGLALGFAFLTGKRIAAPIAALAAAGGRFGGGDDAPTPGAHRIDEISRLDRALRETARTAEERQQRLQEQATQMQQADRRKDEFLATLAHELRNPLAPLRNAAYILRDPRTSEAESKWSRDVIERQVRHMARLLDDLLDVSRITRGRLELRKERCALAAVVGAARETSQPAIEDGSHELSVELPREEVELEADPIRLSQVLSNLLNNAARYTPSGGRIRLRAERHGRELRLTVADNGVGIPPHMLPHVFDMFSQGDSGTAQSSGGLGIGLALARGLVEAHGGTIEARSEGPGRGSEFIVRLPIVREAATPAEAPPAAAGTDTRAYRILVVDDLEENAISLAAVLRGMGHDVHTAGGGQEAVVAAARFLPQIVLLDIGMPHMNGYDACRHIRDIPGGESMLIVAVTGWGQDKDRQDSARAGFDDHLVKPVDPASLDALIQRLGRARGLRGAGPNA